MSHDPWLDIFNASVRACVDCKHAQQAFDDEWGIPTDSWVTWCDVHSAQFKTWADAQRTHLEPKP